MFDDLMTVMWKEQKSLLRSQGSNKKTLLSIFFPVLMLAIVFPLQMSEEWTGAAWSLVAAFLIPMITIGIVVPQAFAGEREKHTLETLLASRLPDQAILFGKLLTAVAAGWGLTLLVMAVSLIPANLLSWTGRVRVFDLDIALADFFVSLLISGAMASLGVLVSLRSKTAQGAQQTLIAALMIPLVILQLVPMLLLSAIPGGRDILQQVLSINFSHFTLVVAGILLVLNVGLLLAAMNRFQRSRLSSD
jgi:ABC-2 type transport system permease protein